MPAPYADERRLGLVGYLIALLCFVFLSLTLDNYVTLDSCEYDSCRYLRFSVSDTGLEDGGGLGMTGTQAMHNLYGSSDSANNFLSGGIINFAILSIFLAIAGIRRDLLFFPLSLGFLVLPGKEFFVIAAIIIFFSNCHNKKPDLPYVIGLSASVTLLIIARPSYIPVLIISRYFWSAIKEKPAAYTLLLLLSASVALGAGVDLLSPPDPDHAALQMESSIEAISVIRGLTFGFEPENITFRSIIYTAYLLALPVFEIYRLYADVSADVNSPAQLYALGAIISFLIYLPRLGWGKFWRMCCVAAFTISSTYPFLHTRYLLPIVVMIYYASLQPSKHTNQPYATTEKPI